MIVCVSATPSIRCSVSVTNSPGSCPGARWNRAIRSYSPEVEYTSGTFSMSSTSRAATSYARPRSHLNCTKITRGPPATLRSPASAIATPAPTPLPTASQARGKSRRLAAYAAANIRPRLSWSVAQACASWRPSNASASANAIAPIGRP